MSAKNWTPGPWAVKYEFPNSTASIDGGRRDDSSAWYGLATVYVMTEDEDGGESFDPVGAANARLIAAAPDLYEALEAARDYVTTALRYEQEMFAGHEHCGDIETIEADLAQIDAALAKARGEA